MQRGSHLDRVRQFVQETFRELNVGNSPESCETILIRDGYYCGRCFSCDGLRAIWFVEEKVIKVYGRDGEFLLAHSLKSTPHSRDERAA